ncbi:hypothetical protein N2152v2_010324 [Parachlorella kessleri]
MGTPHLGNSTFGSLPTTIFEEMSRLAQQHQSTNLGQGFPDDQLEGPKAMKEVVAKSLLELSNQYPPLMGVPGLRQAIARHSQRYTGLPLDWQTEVLVTVGATEALAAAFLGLLNEGDEVILFEPLYDSYVPMVRRAGAVPVIVQLQPPNWTFQLDELQAAFSSRTRLVVVNTPHNPTGKVFSLQELQAITGLCAKHNCLALLDEVYQHLVFPGTEHATLAQLPDMAARCLRVGSAGKTFSFTAWKVGWISGPAALVAAVAKAHQFLIFTVPSALQQAVAYGLDEESEFYCGLGAMLLKKRSYLERELAQLGFDVLPAQGTYFLVADFSELLPEGSTEGDVAFCHRLTKEAGVTLIPVSAFYDDRSRAPRTLVRFVFCKTDEKLQTAVEKLHRYFDKS